MSYCNKLPEKNLKKHENFNNSYMLLKQKSNECTINYYNIFLVLCFIVFVYLLYMKYGQ
jgi:hypothetical protein